MRSFFLMGGYCGGNPGDEAILKSTLYYLNDLFPNSHFYIWTDQKYLNITFDRCLSYEFVYWKALDWMFSNNLFCKIITKLYTDLFPISKKILKLFIKPNIKFTTCLRDSEKVIFTGGGYINSDFSLIQMNYLFDVVNIYEKRVFLLGQTLGPFKKKVHHKMANEIFNSAEKIVLREEYSMVEVLNYKNKIIQGIDEVTSFRPRITPDVRKTVGDYFSHPGYIRPLYIGINLLPSKDSRKHYFALAKEIESFANSLNGLVRVKLFFIPMETSALCDDRIEGMEFKKYISSACDFVILKERLSVESKFYFISQCDLVVGMRLHTLLFSLIGGVPTIGLYNDEYYFRKITGVLKTFGMVENHLSFNKIDHLSLLLKNTLFHLTSLKAVILNNKTYLLKDHQNTLRRILET